MTELSLNVSRTIKAPAENVFNAWLDPELLAKFMMPGDGMSVPSASNDPVEGGRFDIVMAAGENEMPHHGTYNKIARHSQIVFTWNSPFSTDAGLVTIDFEPTDGGTMLTLSHIKFADEESRDNHAAGWARILTTLDDVIT